MNDLTTWCAEEYSRDHPPRKPHSTRKAAGAISVVCHWCGTGETFTDTNHGRQMLNAWPENHRNECNDHRSSWRAN